MGDLVDEFRKKLLKPKKKKIVRIKDGHWNEIRTLGGLRQALRRLDDKYERMRDSVEAITGAIVFDIYDLREAVDGIEAEVKKMIREGMTGPPSEREEIVGTSTRGKNKNMGNTGFSGGFTARLVAA